MEAVGFNVGFWGLQEYLLNFSMHFKRHSELPIFSPLLNLDHVCKTCFQPFSGSFWAWGEGWCFASLGELGNVKGRGSRTVDSLSCSLSQSQRVSASLFRVWWLAQNIKIACRQVSFTKQGTLWFVNWAFSCPSNASSCAVLRKKGMKNKETLVERFGFWHGGHGGAFEAWQESHNTCLSGVKRCLVPPRCLTCWGFVKAVKEKKGWRKGRY